MKLKKFMGAVLSVCMVASMIPGTFSVSADEATPSATDNVEIALTDTAKCYNEGNAFKYALDGAWASKHIVSADSLAYLKSGTAAMDKITAAVTVSGTVAEEFKLNLCYAAGDYAYWGEGNSANKAMSADTLNVTEPGVYYISMAFDTTANPTELNYIGIQGSSNSYKNNPNAAVTIEELYINDVTTFIGIAYKSLGYSIFKGYDGPFKTVAIPTTYEDLPVNTINSGAFDKNANIKSVYIPDCITSVGGYAFRDCTSLESVRLPEGLKKLSTSLFQGCTSLKTVEIPESVTEISGYAFMESGITSIVIPDTVTKIGNSLFKDATNLKDVTLPSGITAIPSYTFSNSGLETYTVPDSVTSIASSAFEGCAKLESVTIPNADIEAWAFQNCTSLTSVTLPEGKKIGIQSFMGCTSLENIVIPENVDLYPDAFSGTGLKEVTLPISINPGSQMFGYTSDGQAIDGFIIRSNLESVTKADEQKIELTEDVPCYDYAKNNGFIFADEYQNKLLEQDITDAVAIKNDNDDYTAESFANLQKAIEDANKLTNNSDREDVIESRKQIKLAIDSLKEKSQIFDELKTVIASAEAIDTNKYTSDTVAELTSAIKNAKEITENSTINEMIAAMESVDAAVNALVEKPSEPAPTEPEPSNPTKPDSSKPATKTPTTAKQTTKVTAATRSPQAVAKDKAAAEKLMKQAKITKLTVKSKAKKKITVTWKKVKKAVGYEVEVNTNKKFKKSKIVLTKTTSKKKLVIKNKKIKSGKKYFVRVRAYATYKDANGTAVKVYSAWNKKLRKVTVK